MKKLIGILMVALISTAATAQESPNKLGLVMSLGLNTGGDTLASGTYTNGESFSIKAGGGTLLSIGAAYLVNDKIDIQATIGHESDSTDAVNGSINFKRSPMEVLGFYNFNDSYRLGAGLRQVSSATLTTSGVAARLGSSDFSASAGTVLEGQYFFTPRVAEKKLRLGLFVRYVTEKYTSGSTTVNGDHLGMGLTAHY